MFAFRGDIADALDIVEALRSESGAAQVNSPTSTALLVLHATGIRTIARSWLAGWADARQVISSAAKAMAETEPQVLHAPIDASLHLRAAAAEEQVERHALWHMERESPSELGIDDRTAEMLRARRSERVGEFSSDDARETLRAAYHIAVGDGVQGLLWHLADSGSRLGDLDPSARLVAGIAIIEAVTAVGHVVGAAAQHSRDVLAGGPHTQSPYNDEPAQVWFEESRRAINRHVAQSLAASEPRSTAREPDDFGAATMLLMNEVAHAVRTEGIQDGGASLAEIWSAAVKIRARDEAAWRRVGGSVPIESSAPVAAALALSGAVFAYAVSHGQAEEDAVSDLQHIVRRGLGRSSVGSALDAWDLFEGGVGVLDGLGWVTRRVGWLRTLTTHLAERGWATTLDQPSLPADTPELLRLIEMQDTDAGAGCAVWPGTAFAVRVLGTMSGESEEALRQRPGLRSYYVRIGEA